MILWSERIKKQVGIGICGDFEYEVKELDIYSKRGGNLRGVFELVRDMSSTNYSARNLSDI